MVVDRSYRQAASAYWESAAKPRMDFFRSAAYTNDETALADLTCRFNDEISVLYDVISSLRMCMNMLVPVNRLPIELLTRIFSLCADPHGAVPARWPQQSWIQNTQVCRRWRHAALQSPTLWKNADLAWNEQWLEETFSRSKTLPIDMTLSRLVRSPTQSKVDLVRQHLGHTRALVIPNERAAESGVGRIGLAQAFLNVLAEPMPLLEVLDIRTSSHLALGALPDASFSNSTPRIRVIKLRNTANFSWALPSVSHVVQLSIEFESAATAPPPPPFSAVVDALHRMPNLEELRLIHCLPRSGTRPSPLISLPNLKDLALIGDVEGCKSVIQCLQMPRSVRRQLELDCRTTGDATSFFPTLSSHLDAHVRPFTDVVFSNMEGDECDFWTIRAMHARHDPQAVASDVGLLVVKFNIAIGDEDEVRVHSTLLRAFMREVPIIRRHVEALLFGVTDWSTEEWTEVLYSCSNLEYIAAAFHGRPLCEALAMSVAAEGGARVVCCPKLTALSLSNCEIEGCDNPEPSYVPVPLAACLRARRDAQAQVGIVELVECSMSASGRSELEALVPRLVVQDEDVI